jgi:hypothetical protein
MLPNCKIIFLPSHKHGGRSAGMMKIAKLKFLVSCFFSRITRYIGGTHNARTLIPINTHAHSYPYEHLSE